MFKNVLAYAALATMMMVNPLNAQRSPPHRVALTKQRRGSHVG